MKTWHIWDFPDTTYIYLKDNFREEFFNKMFKEVGGKRPYARFLGLTQMTVKSYHKGYTYKKRVKHSQSVPLSLFRKSLLLMNKKLKEKLKDNIYFIKAHGKSIPVLNPKLPIKESPAFYRIVAHIIGDGSVPKNHLPYYANTCKELRDQFKEDLKIFGEVDTKEVTPNTTPIIEFPKIITNILSYVLKIKFTYPDKIPRDIFSASKECKGAFLGALFDDEGSASNGIVIRMKDYNLIKEVGKLIEQIGIRINKILITKDEQSMATLSINSKYIGDFKEKIGFTHPIKLENLEASIDRKKRKQRTRSPEIIEREIIEGLRKRQMRTIKIANNIQLTIGHALKHLKQLENEGKVKRSGFKNRIIWSLT